MMTVSPDIPYWILEWLPTITSPSTIILFVSILVLSGTRKYFRICSVSEYIFHSPGKTVPAIWHKGFRFSFQVQSFRFSFQVQLSGSAFRFSFQVQLSGSALNFQDEVFKLRY